MKLMIISVCFAVLASVSAITVEDAWKAYKENPKKAENPSWVKDIPNFETFKSQWDEAKAFNAKYAVAENAWSYYKVK